MRRTVAGRQPLCHLVSGWAAGRAECGRNHAGTRTRTIGRCRSGLAPGASLHDGCLPVEAGLLNIQVAEHTRRNTAELMPGSAGQRDARQVLEAALRSLHSEMGQDQASAAGRPDHRPRREGEVNEACRIGSEALALADRQQVPTNLQDVRRLRLDLEPWRDTQAVRELDEQLAAVGGAG
jgi:hypothetical protein